MRLTRLFLEQFRSYSRQQIDFSPQHTHILLGHNGAGKTNILEAISILSLSKSCLNADEADIIAWGEDFYRVRGAIENGPELEVVSQLSPRKAKACFINDVRTPVAKMVGTLPTVLFLPRDLQLFTGAPGLRRQFLDQLLSQVSPEYLQSVSQYGKILKQRNSLLKKIAEGSSDSRGLSTWDQQLSEQAATVTLKRLELMELFQVTLAEELTSLGEQWSDVALEYQRKTQKRDQQELIMEMQDLLEHYRQRDLILQSTSVGPHREDWHLVIDGHQVEQFASRGQQRTAILALLFLQVSYLELKRGEKPIILLDDVFSELDEQHQQALVSSLDDHQVIITTTHLPENIGSASVYEVGSGAVVSAP